MDVYQPTAPEWDEDLKALRLRLVAGLVFLAVVTVVGVIGFRIVDPTAGWVEAFFMTAITLTTVGYGEVIPLETHGARIFTAVLILVGMGGVLYFVSTGTAFILEGRIGHVFRRRRMEKDLARLSGHLIVCGSGPTAIYTARELASVRRPVVLVVEHPEEAARVRLQCEGIPIVVGDPAHDDILILAGADRASGLVACTESDKENLVVTLTARQLNRSLRIVSLVTDVHSEAKLRRVGADAVVSPNLIGGLRIASELIRPTVVSFLDVMLRDRDASLRIDEVRIPEGSPAVGRALGELSLGDVSNALLLAVREPDGRWQYNPPADREVAAGNVLIFLGSPEDARTVCRHVGGEMVAVPTAAV